MRFLLSLLAACVAACGAPQAATPPDSPLPRVRVAAVTEGPARAAPRAFGVVRAVEQADLAFLVGGRLSSLEVEVGDRVEAGQVLARVDATAPRQQLEQLEARRRELQARLASAERARARAVSLGAVGSVAEARQQDAETEVSALSAALQALDAQRGEARWAVAEGTLVAPFAGWVSSRSASLGQVVGAGVPVLGLRGDQGLEVAVALAEVDLPGIEVGGEARVRLPRSGDVERSGWVTHRSLAAGPEGLFAVVVRMGDGPPVPPGAAAEVVFAPRVASALRVPASAVLSPGGQAPRVRVVREGRVEERPVELLAYDRGQVALRGSLAPAERVVISGQAGLRAGDLVEVLP